jgi:hypothetical protein
MIPIVFGYPSIDMFEAGARGEIALGGFVVMGEDPSIDALLADRT